MSIIFLMFLYAECERNVSGTIKRKLIFEKILDTILPRIPDAESLELTLTFASTNKQPDSNGQYIICLPVISVSDPRCRITRIDICINQQTT
jgi:hypothetical protein